MKKSLKLSVLVILLSGNLFAQYNWQALPNAPKSWRNDDIYFLNPMMGWAIHGNYQGESTKQYGQIYRTKDGGNTWQLMKDSSNTFYRAVGFADSLTGWVGNLADTNPYYGSYTTHDTIPLYQTNDGGKTWTPANLPNPHPIGICGISVVNDTVIYAYGRWNSKWFNTYTVGFVKTTDKGKTWTYHDMSTYCIGMVDGWFFNKDTGFIAGAGPFWKAQILSTVDGGNTWNICYRSTRADTDEVWKVFFPSRDTGYGSIEYQQIISKTSKRYFTKTVDGGKTWTEYPFIASYDEEGIGFINDTIGWIGGAGCDVTYITYNGGKNWSADNNFGVATPPYAYCSPNYVINRFRKLNDTLMYASGNTVYKLSGKITGISEPSNNKPEVQNFPNPYTSQTTIEYTLTQSCKNIKIQVFAAMGQLIFSQSLGSQVPGKHEYVFSKDIYSGAYFYTITSDEYVVTRKMIKVK